LLKEKAAKTAPTYSPVNKGVKLPQMESQLPDLSNCHLCNSESELQNSHIIPRSYFKNLKGKSGQLFFVSTDTESGVVSSELSNSDPKEKLLCWECEQYISHNFEQYGTRLFKNHKKVTRTKQVVIFTHFRFKEFYLFLISILWRVSISSLPRYEHIDLGEKFNDLLRHCVKENKIKIQTSLRLDHFFKISVIRIVDKSKQIDDKAIKKILFDFNYEKGDVASDGMVWYFMIDGFLIIYNFSPEKDIHEVRTKRVYAQITNKHTLSVPISDITNFKQLVDGISSIRKQAVKHNKR
jgi:hypothetical protein